jgi:hypothetical protein
MSDDLAGQGSGPASYVLAAEVPELVLAGEPFAFEMTASGPAGSSTHIGAHYWSTSTDNPNGMFGEAGGCAHQANKTTRPGIVTVACTIPAGGVIFVRGHVRITDGETILNSWAPEQRVDVLGFQFNAEGASTAHVCQPYQFTLDVVGNGTTTSDKVGAYYWTSPPSDSTAEFSNAAGGCIHQAQPKALPGTFQVTCEWAEAGTFTIHGHARVGGIHNLWSEGWQIVVR